ncbi:MAG: hypothetical protein QG591_755 [Planctomycetota bacterium]|nr:hypothetical protein [Planctomycetota bacterium]
MFSWCMNDTYVRNFRGRPLYAYMAEMLQAFEKVENRQQPLHHTPIPFKGIIRSPLVSVVFVKRLVMPTVFLLTGQHRYDKPGLNRLNILNLYPHNLI